MIRKLDDDTALVVLSTTQNRIETDLIDGFGAVAVSYEHGREEDVVDVVRSVRSSEVMEQSK